MTGTQNATSGTKETAQHPRENMGSIMHFDGLETGSKWTIPFRGFERAIIILSGSLGAGSRS